MAELEIKPTKATRLRVGALMLTAGLIVFLLVWLLTDGGAGLFARKTQLRSFMPDATGLEPGAPVRLSGIDIGKVSRVAISNNLDIQRAVLVEMLVESRYLPNIPADSVTGIDAETLVGDKFVDIDAGKSPVPVAEFGELRSQPAAQAADQADLIKSIQDSMSNVDAILIQVSSPNSKIGGYVVGEKEYDQVLRTISVFEKTMRSSLSPDNVAGNALFTMELYNKIHQPLLNIDNTLQSIQKGEGAAGRLYASDQQYNQILQQLRDLQKTLRQVQTDLVADGAKLRDDQLYLRIHAMLASTDAMITALNHGEGSVGGLLNNPQLYESLTLSMKNLAALLQDIQDNPRKYLRLKAF